MLNGIQQYLFIGIAMRCVRSVLIWKWKCKWIMEMGSNWNLQNIQRFNGFILQCAFNYEYKSLMHHMIVSIFRFKSNIQNVHCSQKTNTLSCLYRFPERCLIHLKMKIANGTHSLIWFTRINHVIVQFFLVFSR